MRTLLSTGAKGAGAYEVVAERVAVRVSEKICECAVQVDSSLKILGTQAGNRL